MDRFLLPDSIQLLFTCEHGGNEVPAEYQMFFTGHKDVLQTHSAYDIGALELARYLADGFSVPLYESTITRLLVDLNRSGTHKKLFSAVTKVLPPFLKQNILQNYYLPHWKRIESRIADSIKDKRKVIHIGVHSFTPVLNGNERKTDIGLLYDPRRKSEKNFCVMWKYVMEYKHPRMKVRFNYPYLGSSDGLVTSSRKRFPEESYLGIELEINQKFPLGDEKYWMVLQNDIYSSLVCCFN